MHGIGIYLVRARHPTDVATQALQNNLILSNPESLGSLVKLLLFFYLGHYESFMSVGKNKILVFHTPIIL